MTELERFYGVQFLGEVDIAYRQHRMSGWFNMLCSSTTAEPPLSRHLLLAYFLFRDAEHFWRKLGGFMDVDGMRTNDQSDTKKAKPTHRKSASATAKPSSEQRARELMRDLIDHARIIPNCSIEDLWAANYGMMKRLVAINADAILELRKRLKRLRQMPEKQRKLPNLSEKDGKRSQAIRELAQALYESVDKPERVNLNRLASGVGINPYCLNPEHYPQTALAFKDSTESNWHFYARRILWTMLANKHCSYSSTKLLSGVEHYRALVLLEFFRDVDTSVQLKKGTVASLLAAHSIDQNLVGPCPDRDFPPAGRRFYAEK
jgi:hypothetical protein